MPVTFDQFVQQLEDSGILAGDTLADFIPPKASPENAEELVRELVRQRKLTRFQAEEVSKGNARSLVLGNYVLLEKIGAGGMGQVFKARHRRMDRIVAVKLLPAALTKDPAARARFEREVKAAARLSHPNIVTAHDADCANDVHFLVMECVEGSDLSALIKKHGPFTVDQVVSYIIQAARGLEAAHEEGIIHRDIKPANLLLDKKGVVKILDMGLARIDAAADEETQAELTRAGIVMGTVDYMAPEQARDTKSADARADIYSLGCTLHYLLTGRTVYGGDKLMTKLVAHRTKPVPSLRTIRPEVPETVDAVFQRMLAKDVAERYQSMGEVIAALEPNARGVQPPAALGETQQFAVENTQTGLADFLQHMVIDPQPPVTARKPVSARKPRLSKDWLKSNKQPLLIGAGLLGVLLIIGLIISLQSPESRPTVSSDDFGVQVEVPVDRPTAAGNGSLAFQSRGFDDWAQQVAALPAEEQVKAVVKKLVDLNPGFDGKVTHGIENGAVTGLVLFADELADISPVRSLASLRDLSCHGSGVSNGKLADLAPLQAMQLSNLEFSSTQVSDLSPLKGMPLLNLNCAYTNVSDLSPLSGMPLTTLSCQGTPVSDLSPLKGMALTHLDCSGTQVSDLSPLSGMPLAILRVAQAEVSNLAPLKTLPLTTLTWSFRPFRDTELLRSLKTLETINGRPLADFWKEVDAQQAAFDAWIAEVAALPAEEQVKAVVKKLQELNPEFDGMETHLIVNGVVQDFRFLTHNVTDISPVRALTGLTSLQISGNGSGTGRLSDLSPLKGMRLSVLGCFHSQVSDLSPLTGMALRSLHCGATQVSDLSPLAGMSLTALDCDQTQVSDLSPLKGMGLTTLSCNTTPVADLSPLQGMPLSALGAVDTQVADIAPLTGMALTYLGCAGTKVSDLSPLQGMPLKTLLCPFNPYRDTDLLRSIKSLEQINHKPAANFWKEVDSRQAAFDAWTKGVVGLSAEKQVEAVATKLRELNPDFDGQVTPTIESGVVTGLQFLTDNVTDISPVRALANLKILGCNGSGEGVGKLADLSPLTNMKLSRLHCYYSQVSDLTPLRGMPLTQLVCFGTPVSDLSPLNGLQLTLLEFYGTQVRDLSPLRGMPLTHVACSALVSDLTPLSGMRLTVLSCALTGVSDLSPVKGMPLTDLNCGGTSVSDLSPLKGMPLSYLYCSQTRVSDLSPIMDSPLTTLWCDFKSERDAAILRSIKTLETINGKPAAEFWKEVEGELANPR